MPGYPCCCDKYRCACDICKNDGGFENAAPCCLIAVPSDGEFSQANTNNPWECGPLDNLNSEFKLLKGYDIDGLIEGRGQSESGECISWGSYSCRFNEEYKDLFYRCGYIRYAVFNFIVENIDGDDNYVAIMQYVAYNDFPAWLPIPSGYSVVEYKKVLGLVSDIDEDGGIDCYNFNEELDLELNELNDHINVPDKISVYSDVSSQCCHNPNKGAYFLYFNITGIDTTGDPVECNECTKFNKRRMLIDYYGYSREAPLNPLINPDQLIGIWIWRSFFAVGIECDEIDYPDVSQGALCTGSDIDCRNEFDAMCLNHAVLTAVLRNGDFNGTCYPGILTITLTLGRVAETKFEDPCGTESDEDYVVLTKEIEWPCELVPGGPPGATRYVPYHIDFSDIQIQIDEWDDITINESDRYECDVSNINVELYSTTDCTETDICDDFNPGYSSDSYGECKDNEGKYIQSVTAILPNGFGGSCVDDNGDETCRDVSGEYILDRYRTGGPEYDVACHDYIYNFPEVGCFGIPFYVCCLYRIKVNIRIDYIEAYLYITYVDPSKIKYEHVYFKTIFDVSRPHFHVKPGSVFTLEYQSDTLIHCTWNGSDMQIEF